MTRIALVVMALMTAFYVSVSPITANDIWLQMKVGEIIAETGRIPDTLLFPFTEIAQEKFNAHEWLASLAFYEVAKHAGEASLPLFQGCLGVLLFVLLACLSYLRNGGSMVWALAFALAGLWGENYRHTLRPELLATVILVAYWVLLEVCRCNLSLSASLAAMVMVALWANIHGSVVIAPVLSAAYAIGVWVESRKKPLEVRSNGRPGRPMVWLGLVVATCLAMAINPAGVELLRFALDFGTQNYVRQYVPEWMPTFAAMHLEARGYWIGITLTVLLLAGMGMNWRKTRAEDLVLVTFFTFLAFSSIRFLAYMGLVFVFVGSAWGRTTGSSRKEGAIAHLLTGLFFTVTLAVALSKGNAHYSTPTESPPNVKFSEGLVLALGNPVLHGNVYNSIELGSELVFRAYPRLRPSIDSRIDSYGLEYILYQRALLEDRKLMDEFVGRYDVHYLLLDSVRFAKFQASDNWRGGKWSIYFQDGKEVLLQRVDTKIAPPPV